MITSVSYNMSEHIERIFHFLWRVKGLLSDRYRNQATENGQLLTPEKTKVAQERKCNHSTLHGSTVKNGLNGQNVKIKY